MVAFYSFLTSLSSSSSSSSSSIHYPVGVWVPGQWSLFLSRQQRAASSTGPQRRRNKRRRRRRKKRRRRRRRRRRKRRRRRPAVGRQPPKGEGGRPAPMLWQIAADSTRPQLLDRRPWNRKTLSSGMIFQVLQTTEALICSSCELSKVSLLKDCDICLPDLSIVKRILDEKIEDNISIVNFLTPADFLCLEENSVYKHRILVPDMQVLPMLSKVGGVPGLHFDI